MTGLIYVAIIALWAAVLIPIWLRRHDADEVRAVDRFDNAMRALGRFRRGSRDSDVLVKGRAPATQSATAAQRRSLVFAVLLGFAALSGIAWLIGLLPFAVVLLALVLLVAFAFVARRQAQAERAAARRRRARGAGAGRTPSDAARDEERAVTEPRRRTAPEPPRPRPSQRRTRVYAEHDYELEVDTHDVEEREFDHARGTRRDLRPSASWDAQPQTLPTYVDAPAASAVRRNLDRSGAWDAGAMLEQARVQRAAAIGQDIFDQYADDADGYLAPHRRAAGA